MSTTDAGIRQLKNGNWAFRFSISVNGQKISQRGSTNSEGQPLKTKTDAIRARKKAIKLAQLAPELPVKEKEPEKLTVAQVFEEYREKGRSDRAYNTILKQDSLWLNHLQEAFGSRILDEIEVAEITDYLAKLYYEEEYSFRYVESFLKMFYLILIEKLLRCEFKVFTDGEKFLHREQSLAGRYIINITSAMPEVIAHLVF